MATAVEYSRGHFYLYDARSSQKDQLSSCIIPMSKFIQTCRHCGDAIPLERLEILPETITCVSCSKERPYRAFVSATPRHKGIELSITKDSEAAEQMDRYQQS